MEELVQLFMDTTDLTDRQLELFYNFFHADYLDQEQIVYGIRTCVRDSSYAKRFLLIHRENSTGRNSARALESAERASRGQSQKDRRPIFSQYDPSKLG